MKKKCFLVFDSRTYPGPLNRKQVNKNKQTNKQTKKAKKQNKTKQNKTNKQKTLPFLSIRNDYY